MSAPIPTFHDGNLIGVRLANRHVVLTLKRSTGEYYELALSSVDAFQMDDFREGNIITILQIIQHRTPSHELLERLFVAPHPAAATQYHDAYAKFLAGKVAMVEAGHSAVIVIIPSYGADLVAFCASFELRALGTSGS